MERCKVRVRKRDINNSFLWAFNLQDGAYVTNILRVRFSTTLAEVRELVAKKRGISAEEMRAYRVSMSLWDENGASETESQ